VVSFDNINNNYLLLFNIKIVPEVHDRQRYSGNADKKAEKLARSTQGTRNLFVTRHILKIIVSLY